MGEIPYWSWFSGVGPGYTTVDINLAPATVGVQVNLYGNWGGGGSIAGIMQYRRRLSSGQDEVVDFGEWFNWPPVIVDHISSVTIAIAATDQSQAGYLVARMDFF